MPGRGGRAISRRAFEFGLLVLPVLVLLGLAAYVAWIGWGVAADAEVGFHGVAAMLLGVFSTLAITALLVGLLLYSRRHGYDQSYDQDRPTGRRSGPEDGDA